MTFMKLVALGAAALLACAPVAAQNIATLPNAATLTGAEKMPAAQGTGCPTKVQPCANVAVSPAQIATYLALAPVASSGLDTALLGAAWTVYTPTLACTSGAPTNATASGRYKRVGKTVFVQMRIAVNANGTCTGALIGGLPFAVVATGNTQDIWTLAGHEAGPSGSRMLQALAVQGSSTVTITIYNNSYPAADSVSYTVSGLYEGA